MSSDGWELLVDEARHLIAQNALRHIAVGIVAHWRSSVLILQRGTRCYLPHQYEIPNDLLKPSETIKSGLGRILRQQTALEIKAFGGYLTHHDYKTAGGEKSRLFVFWVEVLQPQSLKPSAEFAHALFIFFDEAQRYGFITPFLAILIRFWFGANLEEHLLRALCETAKKEGIWRHKVRVAIRRGDGQLLLLKRPRRAHLFPMLYEMPGGNVEYDESLLTACQRHLGHQTQLQILQTLEYLGHFDYLSKTSKERIREFFILLEATEPKSFQIKDHAHGLYVDLFKLHTMNVTKSCKLHFGAFHRRFFGELFHPWPEN